MKGKHGKLGKPWVYSPPLFPWPCPYSSLLERSGQRVGPHGTKEPGATRETAGMSQLSVPRASACVAMLLIWPFRGLL